jgi:NitT/TauT family transport system substrate-binding protein
MVTVACSQNSNLQVVLDLTEEWDRVAEPGSLVQGCVVVRTEFAKEHPEEVQAFLEDYKASVALLTDDPASAAQKIEETGIFTKAAVAQKAIPHCNVCFVTGEEMQAQLSAFLEIMFEAAPQSIGGAVPGPDFYCILQ